MENKENQISTKSNNIQKNLKGSNLTLQKAMGICLSRVTGTYVEDEDSIRQINNIVSTVNIAFPNEDEHVLLKAVSRGSLGEFGRTYKLTPQEVCIWVREHIKTLGYRVKKAPKLFNDMTNQEKADYLNDLAMRKITSEGYSLEDAQRVLKDTNKWNVADDFK